MIDDYSNLESYAWCSNAPEFKGVYSMFNGAGDSNTHGIE